MDDIKQDSRTTLNPEPRISTHVQEKDKFYLGFFSYNLENQCKFNVGYIGTI